jgi:hypothetical protein
MWVLLGLIPGLLDLVKNWQKNKYDAQVAITTAKVGGDRDVAVAAIQGQSTRLAAVAGSKILTLLVVAFAAPLVIYINKVVVWDIVLGLGSTDPIKGQVAEWANTIIAFVFGAPTLLVLGRMFSSR